MAVQHAFARSYKCWHPLEIVYYVFTTVLELRGIKLPVCKFARAQIRLYCIVARTRKTGVL